MKMSRAMVTLFSLAALTLTASAQTLLIDFGNNTSFRGTNVVNPDGNGNFWNSVDSSVYWPNLIDIDGNATVVGFGFTTATNGTDFFNGPAGTNQDPALVEIDAAALGPLGVNEAVYDFYASATFTIQGLDPLKTYNITFFSSRKFTADTTTVYTVYTSNDYLTAVASTNLMVHEPDAPWLHNSNRVATLYNVSPQFADSLWIGYRGDRGNNGYLNALLIEESSGLPPANEVPIARATLAAGEFQLTLVGENGITYILQSTDDLTNGAAWQTVLEGGNPVSATGDGVNDVFLVDPDPSAPHRSYRLIQGP
jgi:hypothetical protein